jgi:hypothetical protein
MASDGVNEVCALAVSQPDSDRAIRLQKLLIGIQTSRPTILSFFRKGATRVSPTCPSARSCLLKLQRLGVRVALRVISRWKI